MITLFERSELVMPSPIAIGYIWRKCEACKPGHMVLSEAGCSLMVMTTQMKAQDSSNGTYVFMFFSEQCVLFFPHKVRVFFP